MKKILFVLCFLPLLAFGEKVVVDVPGMVCQMCVQGMQKSFKSTVVNPEQDVVVDLDKKTVTIQLAKSLTDEEIKKRVNNAGYNVKKIKRYE